MRNDMFIISSVALSLLLLASVPASAASYQITGLVVDINGNGVPGAKVSIFNKNLQAASPVYTVESGPDIGRYTFDMATLTAGEYMVFADIAGKQSSAMLQVSGYSQNYTVKTIALRNYAAPDSDVITKTTPTATAAPMATDTVAPPTPTPTPSATAVPSVSVTTPGYMFILAILAICIVVLRKKK